jgi:FkbM family methyltransferase
MRAPRHEIVEAGGVEFIVRTASVDRESVEWTATSLFMATLRAVDVAASDTILDLGCHIGSFAIMAAAEKRCRVVGFEPDPSSAKLGRLNAMLNGVEARVEVLPFAIGGVRRSVPLYEATENWGHTVYREGGPFNVVTGSSRAVDMITLSDALAYVDSRTCQLLKFNIEGAEHAMFAEASPESLRRVRNLVGEVHYDLGPRDRGGWVAKLSECGFDVRLVPENEQRAILIASRP